MEQRPEQGRLELFEDIYDALREVVRALGGSKAVGAWLFPHLPIDEAKNKINDCLNRNRREKLDPEQFVTLLRRARDTGCHAAKFYFDEITGYQRSAPLDPGDEMVELQRRYIDSVSEQKRIADRMERLARTPLQTIHGKTAA